MIALEIEIGATLASRPKAAAGRSPHRPPGAAKTTSIIWEILTRGDPVHVHNYNSWISKILVKLMSLWSYVKIFKYANHSD
jgi:hypothetical protein